MAVLATAATDKGGDEKARDEKARDDRAWMLPAGMGSGTVGSHVRPRWRWPFGVALLAWGVYSWAAVWMTEGLHLEIGDSLARMADARAMLFSRDPHLAAVGLYWMPLPTVGQLPFMLLLSPLRHAELSGPLACAFVGAVTVLVMARIAWLLELPTAVAALFVAVYAFSPIVVYTNGNGMSEAWSFLGCAIAMLGYLRWSKQHQTMDLAVLAAGLAVVTLVRYEGLLLAPVVAVFAAVNDGGKPLRFTTVRGFAHDCRARLGRWSTTAVIVVVPTYFVIGLWCFMQYVLVRDPLRWYELQKAQGRTTPGSYPYLPPHTVVGMGGYVLHMVLLITPALAIIAPMLVLLRRRVGDVLTGAGLLAGALIWPMIVLLGLFLNESAGAPRYFEPSVVFVAIGAMWLAAIARSLPRTVKAVVPAALVALLAVSALAGAVALESPRRTSNEYENQFFARVLGHRVGPLPAGALNQLAAWRVLAGDLDTRLAGGDRVLADVSVSDRAFVFTQYPGRYIVNSDRDYLKLLADPIGKFTYLIRGAPNIPGDEDAAFDGILATTSGGHWAKWKKYPVATVYQWIPDPAGP